MTERNPAQPPLTKREAAALDALATWPNPSRSMRGHDLADALTARGFSASPQGASQTAASLIRKGMARRTYQFGSTIYVLTKPGRIRSGVIKPQPGAEAESATRATLYFRPGTAEELARFLEDTHHDTRRPKADVLSALVRVALAHSPEILAELTGEAA
jgi:hypothetical protein